MTDVEWIAKLNEEFGRLKRNREQIPLEKLETTYGKSYKALIVSLTEAADWFADKYLDTLTEHWPRHPKDEAGNNSAVQACGASDNMGYHTGTMQNSRSTYGVGCQYRYIEGLWDNCFDLSTPT